MTHASSSHSHRGGAPVGVLTELPPVELAAIIYLRLWFSGNQAKVWSDFGKKLGNSEAHAAMASFENLMNAVQYNTRRPLMRHNPTCNCFGGDECAFAQLIAAAASGDEHDAMTFALHLFEGVQAQCVMGTAAMCGLAFSSMAAETTTTSRSADKMPTHPMPTIKQ